MTEFLANINWTTVIAVGIYVVNILAIIVVVFSERKTPTASLAWILVLALLPVVGFVFYIILNQNISRYQINKLTEEEESTVDTILSVQDAVLKEKNNPIVDYPVLENWRNLIMLNHQYANAVLTMNNDIQIITDGKELFKDLFLEMEMATRTIECEYFILKNDEVGKAFIEMLTKKAREGVTVRLLIDSQGSRFINNHVLREYRQAGGKVGYFFPPKLAKLGVKIGMKLNYRNHRKIVIIDDEIAYTGGHNVAREYVGLKKRFGYWRDTFIKVRGMAVQELRTRFVQDWRFATKEKLELNLSEMEIFMPGTSAVQVVSCGPDSPREEVKRGFMKMITFAEKAIYIQTPYFVPDPSLLESLKMAALSGVEVNIMIPCKPDHIFVYWATYSNIGELLRNGAHCYIYDNGFLHAKTITVDGEVASVGSTNFDNRSFRLNFETNAFVFDENFAGRMEETFKKDMELSHELTYEDYLNRSVWIKFKEAISRLFSDIL